MWLWDLSSCLGWQRGGPVGMWIQDLQVWTSNPACILLRMAVSQHLLAKVNSCCVCVQQCSSCVYTYQSSCLTAACREHAAFELCCCEAALCCSSIHCTMCMQATCMANQHGQMNTAQHSAMPLQAGFGHKWPEMLGSLCYAGESLPKVCLQNGRTCPIIALASHDDLDNKHEDFAQVHIACVSLTPTAMSN